MSRALPPGAPFIGWASFRLWLADLLDEVGFEKHTVSVLRYEDEERATYARRGFILDAAHYAFRNIEEGDCPEAVGSLIHDFVIDASEVSAEKNEAGFLKLADPKNANRAIQVWIAVERDFKARRAA